MDMERPEKLVKGNNDYFTRIANALSGSEDSFQVLTLTEVVELVNKQLEPRVAEIVVRRLLGQLQDDIAIQMQIGVEEVRETLRNTPQVLVYEKIEGQRYAVHTMAKALGRSDRWVATRVAKYGQYHAVEPTAYTKYHQEVFDSISDQAQKVETLPVATDTDFSRHVLSEILGRDHSWLLKHEGKLDIKGTTKLNPANHVPVTYFTEVDLVLLQKEKEAELQYPVATDRDISINKLATAVQHSREWVLKRLPFIPYEAVNKINPADPSTELTKFYPYPEAVEALLALPVDILRKKT